MGADLLIHTLMWDKKRKLDFKVGHRVIDEMDDDDDSLNAECVCKEDLHAAAIIPLAKQPKKFTLGWPCCPRMARSSFSVCFRCSRGA